VVSRQLVVGRRLPVDVDGGAEIVEDLVDRPEVGVVPPAVDVGGLDIEDCFPESFGNQLRDTGFVDAGRAGKDGGVSGFPGS
jgi:hypothetical protein